MSGDTYYVGRVDCTTEPERFPSLEDAERRLAEIALEDAAGVDRGDYYIDVPEHVANRKGASV